MKKIIVILALLFSFVFANNVVLDDKQLMLDDTITSLLYSDSKIYLGGYESLAIYDKDFNFKNKVDLKTTNLVKLNDNIYNFYITDDNYQIKIYKIKNDKPVFYKTLSFNEKMYLSRVVYNDNYIVLNLWTAKSNQYIYIYDKNWNIVKKINFAKSSTIYLRDLNNENQLTYVYQSPNSDLDGIKSFHKYDINKFKDTVLYKDKISPVALLLKNNIYFSKNNNLYKYNILKSNKTQLATSTIGFNAVSSANNLILIKQTTCIQNSYCCENDLVLDTTKDSFIKNLYHSCNDEDTIGLDLYTSKFFKLNNHHSVLLTYRDDGPGKTIPIVEKYIAIDLNKATYNELKNLKNNFIRTIENKINKTLSSNAKVVIFEENELEQQVWVKYKSSNKIKFYTSVPFAVIDNNKIYFYMNMSFTSGINKYSTFKFYSNNKYKLIKNKKTLYSEHIYAPHKININNKYLGYNLVFKFNNLSLKKGDNLIFIEKEGDKTRGQLYFNLNVKEILGIEPNKKK